MFGEDAPPLVSSVEVGDSRSVSGASFETAGAELLCSVMVGGVLPGLDDKGVRVISFDRPFTEGNVGAANRVATAENEDVGAVEDFVVWMVKPDVNETAVVVGFTAWVTWVATAETDGETALAAAALRVG